MLGMPVGAAKPTNVYRKLILETPGLADYWRFQERSGSSVANEISDGKPATISGGVTPGDTGPGGLSPYAFFWAGGSTSVAISQLSGNDVTIEAWVQTTAAGFAGICSGRVGDTSGWNLAVGGLPTSQVAGTLGLSFDGGGTDTGSRSNVTFNDGKWHHVAAVVDGTLGASLVPSTQIFLYIDGQLVAHGADSTISQPTAPFIISGGSFVIGTTAFAGKIAELAMYNVPLTAAQIMKRYRTMRG